MMHIIDLTHTFSEHMPVYPGDPAPELTKMPKDECMDHVLHTSMHVGTHMDGPLHMIRDGKYLSEIPADRFIGPGKVIDARGREILTETLLDGISLEGIRILFFYTGHAEKFRTEAYYERYPMFSEGLGKRIAETGITVVGMDMPSPDVPPFPVHKILLGKEILIVENLTNLEALLDSPKFTAIALPCKLHADAAPVRAVAMVP